MIVCFLSWADVYLNVMAGELPLELRDNVYNLMKQKTHNANRESNNAHHEPSETHGNLGGFTKSLVPLLNSVLSLINDIMIFDFYFI